MRRLTRWSLISIAVTASACGKNSGRAPTSAMSDDLKRDLQLAATTQSMRISPDEVGPQSHPETALKPKKAPGPKVIRTEHPTVKASVAPKEVAEIKNEVPQVQVMASAPAPSETPSSDAPPLARPSPIPAQSYPGAGPIPAEGSSGSGGGIFGGIFGHGGIGDDDHCDPRGGRRGPMGGMGGMGGIGPTVYIPIPINPRGGSSGGGMGPRTGRPRM